MDNFLEIYNPPKLNQEEIGNLNRPITKSEIDSIIVIFKNSLQTKIQGQVVSQVNSTKHTKKNLYQSFSNSSKRLKKTLYEASIILIPKPKSLPRKKITGQYP